MDAAKYVPVSVVSNFNQVNHFALLLLPYLVMGIHLALEEGVI